MTQTTRCPDCDNGKRSYAGAGYSGVAVERCHTCAGTGRVEANENGQPWWEDGWV